LEALGALVEHDDDRAILGRQLLGGIGQDAIEPLERRKCSARQRKRNIKNTDGSRRDPQEVSTHNALTAAKFHT